MKPPAIAPSAVTVSDRTCELILGVPWRSLKAFCRERGIPIRRIGRRPVVAVDAVRAALEGPSLAPVEVEYNEAEVVRIAATRRGRR